MCRSLFLVAALAAAGVLLAAAPANAEWGINNATGCPWGCATCQPLTPEQLAAKKAEHVARWTAKNAKNGRRLAGEDAEDAEDFGGPGAWGPPRGAWGGNGSHHGWNHTGGNRTHYQCLTCVSDAYALTDGRCRECRGLC